MVGNPEVGRLGSSWRKIAIALIDLQRGVLSDNACYQQLTLALPKGTPGAQMARAALRGHCFFNCRLGIHISQGLMFGVYFRK